MLKAKFPRTLPRIKKIYAASILILFLAAALSGWLLVNKDDTPEGKPKPVPSVSIGCDRVLWKDSELELAALTQNIDKPLFEWVIDGRAAGGNRTLKQKFGVGEHKVVLNASFENSTLTARQSTIVIDSADGISMRDSAASKNQWGFQTMYQGKVTGVKEVTAAVDSLPSSEVNPCGSLSTKALFAGEHKWKAEYRGQIIASGTFNLKEVSEIKITKVEVASSYKAGDTVNGKIILKNTGSTTVTDFSIKTVAVNNNYAWMGDKAKREFLDQYSASIKPGETYDIQVRVAIPEKVSGIRPSGRYTITVTLMLNGKPVDTKSVNTEVK